MYSQPEKIVATTDINSIVVLAMFMIKFIPDKLPSKNFPNELTSIKAIINPNICVTVFNFPHIDAAITFPDFSTAISLYPDTINSLNRKKGGKGDGSLFPYLGKRDRFSYPFVTYYNTKII